MLVSAEKKRNIDWLIIGLAVTTIYVGFCVWVLGWGNVAAFVTSKPTELNTIGDFTAGMFAPIAVIWLVAAVLTQRQELEEAREQSRLAQEQFKDNQKVVDEQLATIKSQNELLQLQHKQSVENAEKAYRLSLYDKRILIYERFLRIGSEFSGTKWDDDGYWKLINLAQEAAFLFDSTIEDWFNEMADHVYQFQQYCAEAPLKRAHDGAGNWTVSENPENDEIKKERLKFTAWLDDQFLPEIRLERFEPFMNVSDRIS